MLFNKPGVWKGEKKWKSKFDKCLLTLAQRKFGLLETERLTRQQSIIGSEEHWRHETEWDWLTKRPFTGIWPSLKTHQYLCNSATQLAFSQTAQTETALIQKSFSGVDYFGKHCLVWIQLSAKTGLFWKCWCHSSKTPPPARTLIAMKCTRLLMKTTNTSCKKIFCC